MPNYLSQHKSAIKSEWARKRLEALMKYVMLSERMKKQISDAAKLTAEGWATSSMYDSHAKRPRTDGKPASKRQHVVSPKKAIVADLHNAVLLEVAYGTISWYRMATNQARGLLSCHLICSRRNGSTFFLSSK